MTKKKFDEYIERAKVIFNNKYDYSQIDYPNITCKTKIPIVCPVHGVFYKSLDNHVSKQQGCTKCDGNHYMTNDEFKEKIEEIYGKDRFDLTNTHFTRQNDNVTAVCHRKDKWGREHGEFTVRAKHFLNGVHCKKCSHRYRYSTEDWVEIAKFIHGDKYDYSKSKYINEKVKITVTCPIHGDFDVVPYEHLKPSGKCGICQKCAAEKNYDLDKFIELATEKHNGKYSYNNFIFKGKYVKGLVTCPEHGDFEITPYAHLRGDGCTICSGHNKYKPVGYWNNHERCLEEAKKYLNRKQLQLKCYGAFNAIKRNSWFDIFEELDKNKEICYRGFDEKIHCVYVYEIREFNTCYIGRTLRLKVRDRQHRNGVQHSNGEKEYDNLYKFCKEHDVDIPKPIILEKGLLAMESLEKEDFYINEYKKRGWNLINSAATGIGSGSLGSRIRWNYENCKLEANRFNSKTEFEKGNQSAYKACVREGWIDEFFQNQKLPNGYWNDIKHCQEVAIKCKDLREMSLNYASAYNAVKRNKWQDKMVFKNETKY